MALTDDISLINEEAEYMSINEASGGLRLVELLSSTKSVRAKLNSSKKVEITGMKPVISSRDFYVSAQSQGSSRNVLYKTGVRFLGVDYVSVKDAQHPVPIHLGSGEYKFCEQLSINHRVMVRCSCDDFYFMWHWWDANNKALLGRRPPKYVRKTDHLPERNPDHAPGLCKHLVKLVMKLSQEGIIRERIDFPTNPGSTLKAGKSIDFSKITRK